MTAMMSAVLGKSCPQVTTKVEVLEPRATTCDVEIQDIGRVLEVAEVAHMEDVAETIEVDVMEIVTADMSVMVDTSGIVCWLVVNPLFHWFRLVLEVTCHSFLRFLYSFSLKKIPKFFIQPREKCDTYFFALFTAIVPPTPPPTAAATITNISATMRKNVAGRSPHIVLFFPASVVIPELKSPDPSCC